MFDVGIWAIKKAHLSQYNKDGAYEENALSCEENW